MPRFAAVLVSILPFGAVVWAQGCGPSVQSVYEGNTRFEHCYRLDFDYRITPTHREACWRSWMQSYTYGQTQDRIEYAKRRIRSLEAGDPARPRLNLDIDGGEPVASEAPMPTSVHAPPPPVAPLKKPSGPSDAGPEAEATAPPGSGCLEGCREEWKRCNSECRADASGKAHKACHRCNEDYRGCVRRCIE